jgi:pimeloyl-ACP methyl ester carboxylesterase
MNKMIRSAASFLVFAMAIGLACIGAEAGDLDLKRGCVYTGADGIDYSADCGTIVVPENRTVPESRLITLPIIRVRATGEQPAEPIFWLSGGPGSSNMVVGGLEVLLDRHDVVMVGYRGVDGSVVLDCPEVARVLKNTGGNLVSEASLIRYGRALARCAESFQADGVDISGYNVLEVVEDMESARVALGYERINFLSASYGTRLAQYYAYMYPDSLFRSAQVAVNPPGHFLWEPDVLDELIEADAALCAQDPNCSKRTNDLAKTVRSVYQNMPSRWLFLPIDPGKVGFVTHFMLFHRGSAAAAYDAYIAAEHGDPSGLAIMSLVFDQMMPSSVTWGEWAAKGFIDYAAPRDWLRDMNPAGSIIGSPVSLLAGGGTLGGSWPVTLLPDWVHEAQASDVETLLVGGNADFSTPVQFATDELLPFLSNGHQVILSEMGHTNDVFGLQNEAMFHMLATFFDTGEVDDSHFEYQPMSFELGLSFPDMAHAIVNVTVAIGLLISAVLVVLF